MPFNPQPMSNEDLQKLREAAQKKGGPITNEKELHEVLKPGEKFVPTSPYGQIVF